MTIDAVINICLKFIFLKLAGFELFICAKNLV